MKPLLCILLLFFISGCTDKKPLDVVYDIRENINVITKRECLVEHSESSNGYYGTSYIGGCDEYSIYAKINDIYFDRDVSNLSTLLKLEEAAIQSGNVKETKKYDDYLTDFSNFYREIECIPENETVDLTSDSLHFECTYNKKLSDNLGIKVVNTSFDLPVSEMN